MTTPVDLKHVGELVAGGRYATALHLAAELSARAAGPDRAEVLILAARAAQQLGLYRETARYSAEALDASGADTVLQARALSAMGAAALQLGDPLQAEEYLLRAAACPAAPDVAGTIHFNLAYAYEMMRQAAAAAAEYRMAAQVFQGVPDAPNEIRARHNLAWLLLEQRDLAGARSELDRTAGLLEADSRLQAQQLALEAFFARQAGQAAEAVRLCEDLLVPGHPGATAWDRCFAGWLMADVAAGEGRYDLARQFLGRARREAEDARDPGLWNRLTELQNRLDSV